MLALLEAGYKVVIADNLYNASVEVINRIELITGKRPDFEQLDITDESAFDKVFTKYPEIDNVIHFAALKVRYLADSEHAPNLADLLYRPLANLARSPSSTTASTSTAPSASSDQ